MDKINNGMSGSVSGNGGGVNEPKDDLPFCFQRVSFFYFLLPNILLFININL